MSRAGEVTAKLARVRGWLDGSDFDAALFSSQPGVAWVTADWRTEWSATRSPRWSGSWWPP